MPNNQKKILVVEDESALVKALEHKLIQAGFEPLKATNGLEGLEVAHKTHPDLILLDIMMPKMDGLTMLAELRKDVWGKFVPVILLTNVNDPAQVITANKIGARDYLVKSDWKLEDVIRKVKEKLEGKTVS